MGDKVGGVTGAATNVLMAPIGNFLVFDPRGSSTECVRKWSVLLLLAGSLTATSGCDFFKELESDAAEDEGGEPEGGSDESAGEETGEAPAVCELGAACEDQDTASWCTDGVVESMDCQALCGSYLNFTCLEVSVGQPACWCVEPGEQKNLTCPELEQCLKDCTGQDMSCADRCFPRTTVTTIRLYGALVHCAYASCQQICHDNPAACGLCVDQARTAGGGDCSLHRAVCDGDASDEPWPT